jgi:hypothetical protein
MKMGTIVSPWRYDDGAKSTIGTKLMRGDSQQHYVDCEVEATGPLWHIMP